MYLNHIKFHFWIKSFNICRKFNISTEQLLFDFESSCPIGKALSQCLLHEQINVASSCSSWRNGHLILNTHDMGHSAMILRKYHFTVKFRTGSLTVLCIPQCSYYRRLHLIAFVLRLWNKCIYLSSLNTTWELSCLVLIYQVPVISVHWISPWWFLIAVFDESSSRSFHMPEDAVHILYSDPKETAYLGDVLGSLSLQLSHKAKSCPTEG